MKLFYDRIFFQTANSLMVHLHVPCWPSIFIAKTDCKTAKCVAFTVDVFTYTVFSIKHARTIFIGLNVSIQVNSKRHMTKVLSWYATTSHTVTDRILDTSNT